jgi:phosphoglycerate dehydrogenase-like enzyme
LLLTPHIAGVTRQASALLFRSAWENVERVLVRNSRRTAGFIDGIGL